MNNLSHDSPTRRVMCFNKKIDLARSGQIYSELKNARISIRIRKKRNRIKTDVRHVRIQGLARDVDVIGVADFVPDIPGKRLSQV
jgi:hypothetical protein